MPRGFFPDDASRYEVMRRVSGGDDVVSAVLEPGTIQASLTGVDNSDEDYYVRVYNRCNLPDQDPIELDLKRVAFDNDGDLILPVPPAPTGLSLVAGPGGLVTAKWVKLNRRGRTNAQSFNVYFATGATPIDFTTVSATSSGGGRPVSQALGTFAHGTTVRVVVRAVSADGTEETNTIEASVVADAQAPDAVASLSVEVTAQ